MPLRSQTHIDAPLTNISVAYIQQSSFIADKVFPIVPVTKQSALFFKYRKEDWFSDQAKERAAGTESAGGDYSIDSEDAYFCRRYSFHKDVTEEDRANTDNPLDCDRDAAEFVTQKLLLKRERDWAKKYFASGVWGTEIKADTDAAGSTPTGGANIFGWNSAKSDPIMDIANSSDNMKGLTGYRPNTMVLGPKVLTALKNHPAIIERIKYTQRGVITLDLLASMFEVQRIFVADSVSWNYDSLQDDKTEFLYGNHALLMYVAPRAALKTPTAGYTFSWTGLEGCNTMQGNRIVRLPMDHLGLGTERIEGDMAYDMRVVSQDLGVFFKDVV